MARFKSKVNEQTNLIVCPPFLKDELIEDFNNQAKSWLLSPVEKHVFDFKSTVGIDKSFYKLFLDFKTTLKNNSKFIFSVNMLDHLRRQIKVDGMEDCLNPVAVVPAEVQGGRKNIDIEFITPFLKGVKSTFEIQCKTPLQVQKPYLKHEALQDIKLKSTLSLACDRFQGSLSISFTEKVFLKIYENLFDEAQAALTEENQEAAIELLNMVYGVGKVELNQKGYSFPKAFPCLATTDATPIESFGTIVVVPFESAYGPLYLEVEFKN